VRFITSDRCGSAYSRDTRRIVNVQRARVFVFAQFDYEEDDEDEVNGTKTRCVYSWLGQDA
jgi:hypothetical protein